ncbi:MAG: DUF411 domain-containing protein [Zoogloeaceae bacterium]|nr:DUF411 domain-containing protein [Zoogloeaceae bacterium]
MKSLQFVFAIVLTLAAHAAVAESLPEVLMYKDPNCGCCGAWAERLEAAGFRVKTVEAADMQAVKRRFGVPERLASCHTAKVGNYVIEGHVPPATIKRLLHEKPAVTGLSAPGMPAGAPGMETPGRKDPYDVVSFDGAGRSRVFERFR